jgi:LuxR family maltose regulon positive regulatory protein
MNNGLFAHTKIQPPRERRSRLQRPQLEAALDGARSQHRVLLLQAPAGFGKTSALAGLLARLPAGTAVAWVSLDRDDDVQRLFACLAAALEPVDLPWRSAPEALVAQIGQDGPAGLQRALAELINALAGAEAAQGLIVIDDLHRAPAEAVAGLLDGLIERLPPAWTVVLSSRTVPPLALARWRAAGELAEFGPEALSFTREETLAWFAAEAEPAVRERAAEFHERTQGWPAGLRLCLSAGPLRGAGRIDRQLFDYLASEVLEQLPPDLHQFLLRCSVLPELTASRCAAVSGDRHAARWLDEIERRSLFVTALEAHEPTLVLHDLLRDALQECLRRLQPQEWPQLLVRAAAGEADALRRVGFLLSAEDWPAAEAALAEAAPALFLQGAAAEVQRLVQQFPPDVRRASARVLRLQGVAAYLRWQWEAMAAALEAAVRAAEAAGDDEEHQLARAYLANALYPLDRNAEAEALLRGLQAEAPGPAARRVALMADCSQHFRRGQLAELAPLYSRVLDALAGETELFAWWECMPAVNWSTLPGMRPVIQRYVRGALDQVGPRPLPMRAEAQMHAAFAALWSGQVTVALELAAAAEAEGRWLAGSGELQVAIDLFRLIEGAMHGRYDEVRQRLADMLQREAHAGPERKRLWQHQMAVYGVRLSDTLGNDAAALRHWSGLLKERPLDDATAQNPRALAVRARYAAAQGRWAEAAERFMQLLPRTGDMDVMGQTVELRLRTAHALLQAGQGAEAAAVAAPALERMRQQDERGLALMCGPAVLDALRALALPDALAAELAAAAELARGLREAAPTPAATDQTGASALGSLSEREREVLERIAAGDSNKLIARALEISPHTVKRHVANILDKLALSGRGQAAAWLRDRA